MSRQYLIIALIALIATACNERRQEPVVTPWGTVLGDTTQTADSDDDFDLMALLAEAQAQPAPPDTAPRRVKRRVYSPFKDRSRGIISNYDHLFKRYTTRTANNQANGESVAAGWDWRLMAAQCYQESCFDPKARSWAGACGLMQIMPATADLLGLPRSSIYDPEANVRAAAKYIAMLTSRFANIPSATERQLFVLAAYNGGYYHINDAQALARKAGKDPTLWRNVAPYVLALEKKQYYTDPVVKHGYMRGSETVDYVEKIRQRYAQYRGVPYRSSAIVAPTNNRPQDLNADPTTATPNGQDSTAAEPYRPNLNNSPYTPHKAKKKHRFQL